MGGRAATAVTLGNFDVLVKELTRLYGYVRIWVTEYGYQTNPPDRVFGVSWADQANYMREAYARLKRNARVDIFIWFLLRDEPGTSAGNQGSTRAIGCARTLARPSSISPGAAEGEAL